MAQDSLILCDPPTFAMTGALAWQVTLTLIKIFIFLVSGGGRTGFCPGSPPRCVVCVFVLLFHLLSFWLLVSLSDMKDHDQSNDTSSGKAEELRKYLSTVVEILPHFIHGLGGHANPFCNSLVVVRETHQTRDDYNCIGTIVIHANPFLPSLNLQFSMFVLYF
ncbi:uncharacterized protein LOC132266701 [Cornus florida]|uniref:uncharacterized protein LOC132266701 n=1 Tax=Cornus florida TaxID=4283 RepID=UPI0028A154AC|nr:uncharacterized protein LOC132266701 [Cornus florida]